MPQSLSRAPRRAISTPTPLTSTQWMLREAKRLHRAAASDSPSAALPVLRRLLAAQVFSAHTLPALFRMRASVQRKHVLRLLAIEAGFESWEACSQALPRVDPQPILQAMALEQSTASLNLWFASEAEAVQFAAAHGGRPVRVGKQAVVLPEDPGGDAGVSPG